MTTATNNRVPNYNLPILVEQITGWHYDRNLIAGTDDNSQFVKLLEEIIEVFMAINPGMSPEDAKNRLTEIVETLHNKGKIKTDPTGETLSDSIGDSNVVLINIAERNKLTLEGSLDLAYADIKNRKGRMIDGVFVKEEDLPENQ